MRHFAKEQLQRARRADLYDFLIRNHASQFKKDGISIHPVGNTSLSIRRGYSGYKDFATDETGNSVDFLVRYLGYQLDDAVFALCGDWTASVNTDTDKSDIPEPSLSAEKLPPSFPAAVDGPYRNLYAFLNGRGIPNDVIKWLIDERLIYQSSPYNNIVFINKERDWGETRGTNTYADRRCKNRDSCSRYNSVDHGWCGRMGECSDYCKSSYHGMIANCRKDGFWWFRTSKSASVAYVCEAAIDAISLYIIHKKKGKTEDAYYVSIGGVAKQPAVDRLKRQIRTVLAVDNDAAGEECRKRNPELDYILPEAKDWNEDLLNMQKS